VVDDDPSVREALAWNLDRAGYRVTVAEDGERGWALLEREPDRYDAVLLDRMMPGMDGMEVLTRIKEHSALRKLPVIMQTAMTARQQILEGLEAGAYYYLTKPFGKKMLLAIVCTALGDSLEYRRLREETQQAVGSFSLMLRGTYAFRTIEEGKLLATLLARCSLEPERIVLGLSELLTNAVEHGNLGITYADKSRLLVEQSLQEELTRRLELPENRAKKVLLEVERRDGAIRYRIRDEGPGFAWHQYLEITPERAFDTHGRGIALSRTMSFDSVEYRGTGSEVIAVKKEPRAG
jgi:DNA-binding response OmpR family regulator